MVTRISSRDGQLAQVFLKPRLAGARDYIRIAGYFRSSIFDLVHDEIASIGRVRIVCNADLDPADIDTAKVAQAAIDQALLTSWNEGASEVDALIERPRWGRLYEILRRGNVEIRVVGRDCAFLHGKAGVITLADGSTTTFMGSVNETATGWTQSYEMLWEDRSPGAAEWVRREFEWLWEKGVPLPNAVIEEIGRTARKVEVKLDRMKPDPMGLIKSVLVESPGRQRGESLMPWQKAFVGIWNEHRDRHGAARLLLADEVGVGKTLSMGAAGVLSVLLGDGPFLILCPATLCQQWQVELLDKLGMPSVRWVGSPRRGWVDHRGHLFRAQDPSDIRRCPYQIGIVSTGLLTTRIDGEEMPEARELRKGSFGMVALDEGHKARVQRGGTLPEPMPGNLYTYMEGLALRTRHLVIGTATPIQTHREEIWDLLRLLALGVDRANEHVLGRSTVSRWHDPEAALDIVSGRARPEDLHDAWAWLRTPLPHAEEHQIFREIRRDLQIPSSSFCAQPLVALDDFTRADLEDAIERGDVGAKLPFLRMHNPLARHVVLRRRKTLEDAGLMPRVGVNLWPRGGEAPALFSGRSVQTPHYYDRAYEEVEAFTKALGSRTKGAAFLKNLLMQRICSSVAAGLSTARAMLDARLKGEAALVETDDGEIVEVSHEDQISGPEEIAHLKRIIALLVQVEKDDPKGRAVAYFLDERRWLEKGCIVFSQYYDTVHWLAKDLSLSHPSEPVAVYAGLGRSGIFLGGVWRTAQRDEIKKAVRDRRLRLVVATDAACEGLNLQTLGTLINVDLPWNPSRLEQRIGRIKRFGQKLSEVDMATLAYAGTVDERIYSRLSERMKDRYDILGSIPDTIEADWIEKEKEALEELASFTSPESPADVFSLRYGDFLDSVDKDWETFEQVIAQTEIDEVMTKPWR